ncbi:MAG: DUF4465 domain-containing protein [Paludibacteraceae bacterium]|nr:DUF4465 domain-containing protein [Paludibacteraceae bacterium]
MKRILPLLIASVVSVALLAQNSFYIYKLDGSVEQYLVDEVERISFEAPEVDPDQPIDPEPQVAVLTFEDDDAKFPAYTLDYCGVDVATWSDLIPAEDEQYYGGSTLIYGDWSNPDGAPYTWTDQGNTQLSHTFPYNYDTYGFAGGGFVISHHYVTLEELENVGTAGMYNYQLSALGEKTDNTFAIAYCDSKVGTDVKVELAFEDGVARQINKMSVVMTALPIYSLLYGSDFSEAYDDDDYLKLVITGYAEDGSTQEIEVMLADGADPSTWVVDWTEVDLSSLGKVTKIAFHMDEAQQISYDGGETIYYKSPLYFAIDDVEVQL